MAKKRFQICFKIGLKAEGGILTQLGSKRWVCCPVWWGKGDSQLCSLQRGRRGEVLLLPWPCVHQGYCMLAGPVLTMEVTKAGAHVSM